MSSTDKNTSDNALLLALYKKKLMDMPDMPSEPHNGKVPTTEVYIRESTGLPDGLPGMPRDPAVVIRTPAMDAYFKQWKFLKTLPDGTATLSGMEGARWMSERPKLRAAKTKFEKSMSELTYEVAQNLHQNRAAEKEAIRQRKQEQEQEENIEELFPDWDEATRQSMKASMKASKKTIERLRVLAEKKEKKEKLEIMPDMSVALAAERARTHEERHKVMEKYIRVLEDLMTLPDGSKVFDDDEFDKWLPRRPMFNELFLMMKTKFANANPTNLGLLVCIFSTFGAGRDGKK